MKMRVLIADPDPALLASYRDFLIRHGFEVALARDGLDCLAQLRSALPDVLVLEPELPWGQGDDILALMEEETDVPNVPVLILSTHLDPAGLEGVRQCPERTYCRKPLAPSDLVEHILRLGGNES